jgi:hypothetical protein
MALITLGSNANNSLSALQFTGAMVPADVGSLSNLILDDLINPGHTLIEGSFAQNGRLYIPNRGYLNLRPGDFVGVDSQGWPILVSANSIANAAWTHT